MHFTPTWIARRARRYKGKTNRRRNGRPDTSLGENRRRAGRRHVPYRVSALPDGKAYPGLPAANSFTRGPGEHGRALSSWRGVFGDLVVHAPVPLRQATDAFVPDKFKATWRTVMRLPCWRTRPPRNIRRKKAIQRPPPPR